ncbi:MAG: caspase family protein [Desulfomonile tiedjei]|uniref:Caspase family protein n=1 Tax=Desulfomonile tiedjei TaxID=2358 RepID=A0A9D6V5J3_9BACT|nr:caspase family protein [Desulfomonile tiedjei]
MRSSAHYHRSETTSGQLKAVFLLAVFLIVAVFACSTARASENQESSSDYKAIGRVRDNLPNSSESGSGDLYVIAVGVSKYKNPKIPGLKLSARDASDFAGLLKTNDKVFRKTLAHLLVDEQATKTEVEKLLYYELLKAGKKDTVVLFFSGHGASDPKKPGDFFFLTHDADPDFLEATAIKMNNLSFLDRLESRRVLVIADACHAGGFSKTTTKSIQSPIDKFVQDFGSSEGRIILSSSRSEEYSQEKQGWGNSVFTSFLLKGLRGEADQDRNGVVGVRELYEYIYDQTRKETEGGQNPQFEGRFSGTFPVSMVSKLDKPLELKVWFVAQDARCKSPECIDPKPGAPQCSDAHCGDTTISNGCTMYAGQNYQIGFRPLERSFVYVFQVGANGGVYKLFPGKEYLAPNNPIENPVSPDRIYWIPSKDAWLHHDDQAGQEKIFVVASRSRNTQLEALYKDIDGLRAQDDSSSLKQAEKSFQEAMERTMAPAKSIRRKREGEPQTDPVSPALKPTSFERFASIIESSSLDAVESVWYLLKRK